MELNQRCIEILQTLRDSNGFVKISDLAEDYNVTDRAIRYSIDKIEKFLVKNNFGYLEREHNKGVKLFKQKKLDEFINSFVNSHTPYKYFFSKEERFVYILVKLLSSATPVSSENLRQKLYTTKNTVLKELYSVEKWLRERSLILHKKHKVGIWVEGRETDKRQAVIELVLQTATIKDILNYINTQTVQSKIINLLFEEIFSRIDLSFLDMLIKQVEVDLERRFSDKAYCQLIIYLALVIKRAALGADTSGLNLDNMKHSIEYDAARKIVDCLNRELGTQISAGEVDHIMLHLLGAEVIKAEKKDNISDHLLSRMRRDKLSLVASQMTEEIEKSYGVNFGKEKRQIIEGLTTHLRSAVFRIKYGLLQANPLYDEIISKYNDIFLRTKFAVRYLEDYIEDRVDEQEISYLTMHFAAALESTKRVVHDQKRVVVVCGAGIGAAFMLAQRLMNEFNVKVVDTVSCRGLAAIADNQYDLIISTIDLPGYSRDRYIKVSPFLGEDDYQKLQERLNSRFPYGTCFELSLVNRLIAIVGKYAQITDEQHLQYEMLYEIKRSFQNPVERRFVYMLSHLLTWDTIKLKQSCRDWKEAIALGTSLIEAKNCVSPAYKEAIIKNFSEFGPYMVVAPGIVLAHARPENGVKKLAMSLITLDPPVPFGHELNDPVKLVVTLAASDNESHLKALSQLMELFMNQEDLSGIMNATNKEEVINVIKKYAT